VVRIADSTPAPNFRLVVQPNDWEKHVKAATAGTISERSQLYWDFWEQFRSRVVAEHPDWATRTTSLPHSWYTLAPRTSWAPLTAAFHPRRSNCLRGLHRRRSGGQPRSFRSTAHEEGPV
jgi:hypothetical protein